MSYQGKRLTLDTGLSCHYLEWQGANPDHTVVLLHGFLEFSGGWIETTNCGLGERYHVIAPDMRGHGDSGRVGAGGYYHFFDYLADLRSLIKEVASERVSIVGHSMGGGIASYYAGSFPEQVERLVVMEGLGLPENTTPVPERIPQWIRGWARARCREPHVYKDLQDAAERLLANDSLLSSERALALAELGTRSVDGGRCFKHDPLHLTMGPMPFLLDVAEQFWRRITCPVLVIDGAESEHRLNASEHDRRVSLIPNAQQLVLPDAGHVMQRHIPELLAKHLVDFIG